MSVKTIVLKGNHLAIRKEAIAGGTINPGDLLELQADGTVEVHGTQGGAAQAAYAVEREVTGDGINTPYVANDTVLYGVFARGSEIYARVAAAAAAITTGDYLQSAGDGTVEALDGGVPVAIALEDVDNSGGAEAVRIKIELL